MPKQHFGEFRTSDHSNDCVRALSGLQDLEISFEESDGGVMVPVNPAGGEPKQKLLRRLIPEIILNRYEALGYYTPEEIIALRKINQNIYPERSSFFAFIHDTNGTPFLTAADSLSPDVPLSGIRFVDGARVPMHRGEMNVEAIGKGPALSFEVSLLNDMGYELPERTIERLRSHQSIVFELGLLNVEKEYLNGIDTLLGIIAREYIDPNYNNSKFESENDTSFIRGMNTMVYLICSKRHLSIYRRKGFEQVLREDTGEPVTNKGGLFLMKMHPAELIENFFDHPSLPQRKGQESPTSEDAMRAEREAKVQYFQGLQNTAPVFYNNWDYTMATYRLSKLHEFLFTLDPSELAGHPWFAPLVDKYSSPAEAVIQNRLTLLFEAYYQLAWATYTDLEKVSGVERDNLMHPYARLLLDYQNQGANYAKLMNEIAHGQSLKIMTPEEVAAFEARAGETYFDRACWASGFLRNWMIAYEAELGRVFGTCQLD